MINQIVFGGGCFWCVEAVFQRLNGVEQVQSGYTGGQTENPTYKEICRGNTGHAEVVKVVYNPEIISLSNLLEVFFAVHNPTTLNKQGADVGTQYRSAIFYNSNEEEEIINQYISEISANFEDPIVTQVAELTKFYPAEDYHENYYNLNSNQPYCQVVISPKIKKIHEKFGKMLKSG